MNANHTLRTLRESLNLSMEEVAEEAKVSFRSIDKALATDRLYTIPRFIHLAQKIQERYPHEPHTLAIADYAQSALRENSQGGF